MPFMGQYDPQDFWPIDDAADVVDFIYQGHTFYLGVARGTEHIFKEALDRIVPLIHGGLYTCPGGPGIGDGDWGREQRMVRGSSSSVSFHNPGLALDVNAVQNPMGQDPQVGQFCLPLNTGALIADLDMEWGGDWSGRKDPMHIELHKTPAEVAQWNAAHTGIPTPAVPVSSTTGGSTPVKPPAPKPPTDWLATVDETTLRKIVAEEVTRELGAFHDNLTAGAPPHLKTPGQRDQWLTWSYGLPTSADPRDITRVGAGRILSNLGIQSGPIAKAVTAVKNALGAK